MGDFSTITQRLDIDTGAVQTLSAQAAGTVNSAVLSGVGYLGVRLVINITAVTGSLTVSIKGIDPVSGLPFNLLTSAALSAVGTTYLELYPGDAAIANVQQGTNLPNKFQVSSVVATGPVTATISATLLM